MRIEGNIVEAAVGKECHATEEDYYAENMEIVRSMTQLQTKLFTASLRRLRKVKSLDTSMVFV